MSKQTALLPNGNRCQHLIHQIMTKIRQWLVTHRARRERRRPGGPARPHRRPPPAWCDTTSKRKPTLLGEAEMVRRNIVWWLCVDWARTNPDLPEPQRPCWSRVLPARSQERLYRGYKKKQVPNKTRSIGAPMTNAPSHFPGARHSMSWTARTRQPSAFLCALLGSKASPLGVVSRVWLTAAPSPAARSDRPFSENGSLKMLASAAA